MFKLPETFTSAKRLATLLTELSHLRNYRRKRQNRTPLRTRIAYFRNILRHRTHDQWPGGYVLLDSGDYFYVPTNVDLMGGYTLLKPLQTEHVINKFCRAGGTAIDIGANIGHWTVPMANAVGENGHVYAFEPTPYIYQALLKTVRANNMQQVTASDSAVADSNGIAEFSVEEFNSGGSRLGEVSQKAEQIKVTTVRLDDFCQTHGIERVDFLKIDVEGFESSVLEGAQQMLQRFKPAVTLECGNESIENRKRIKQVLENANYAIIGVPLSNGIAECNWEDFISQEGVFNKCGAINALFLPN